MSEQTRVKHSGLIATIGWLAACYGAAAQDVAELLDLSIEELATLRVTSVSRLEESLSDAPASIFVITAEEIRRSGVTSLADALRLAPGVEVARRGTQEWSITIRGFNSDLANKLLVLIDGRSVYSPLYAGVFWDVQDTLLEDVERIEVISGPGGTLWGANAVNGVINIITRSPADTEGAFVELGGGNEERGFAGFRYGGTLGKDIAARAYVKYFDRDSSEQIGGGDGIDGSHLAQAGFRTERQSGESSHFTLQGDVYGGASAGVFRDAFTLGTLPAGSTEGESDVAGANVLGRWDRDLDNGDLTLQIYYDYTRRDIPNTYKESRDTFDIDFQHHWALGDRNDVLWGVGFRRSSDELDNTLFASFEPASRDDQTWSAFFQDKIELVNERLFLMLGSKFEDNDYTGFETQPNVRLSWRIDERRTFWTAASRAVRIPSRLDSDLRLTLPFPIPGIPFPVYVTAAGNPDIDSERLTAYEAGYRMQAGDALSFDLAVFHNDYEDLQTVEPQMPIFVLVPPLPYILLPNLLDSRMTGESSGATFFANWQPAARWRLRFQYSRFDLDLETEPGSLDPQRPNLTGNSPEDQLGIYAFAELPRNLSLYTGIRYVDELPNQAIESYTAVDVNLAWQPRERMRASIAVQNLNDSRHLEFRDGANQIERSASIKVTFSF
jgi:iron complex outermembrane receptor protein